MIAITGCVAGVNKSDCVVKVTGNATMSPVGTVPVSMAASSPNAYNTTLSTGALAEVAEGIV